MNGNREVKLYEETEMFPQHQATVPKAGQLCHRLYQFREYVGDQQGKKKQAFISKTKNVNCMKESNFHDIANAKPMLEIAKGKIGAWASHRRVHKGGCTLVNRGSIREASCWQHQ